MQRETSEGEMIYADYATEEVCVALRWTYGVNISFDQIVLLWLQDQVVASEGDDSWLATASRYL